jgi:hypothetical protein
VRDAQQPNRGNRQTRKADSAGAELIRALRCALAWAAAAARTAGSQGRATVGTRSVAAASIVVARPHRVSSPALCASLPAALRTRRPACTRHRTVWRCAAARRAIRLRRLTTLALTLRLNLRACIACPPHARGVCRLPRRALLAAASQRCLCPRPGALRCSAHMEALMRWLRRLRLRRWRRCCS